MNDTKGNHQGPDRGDTTETSLEKSNTLLKKMASTPLSHISLVAGCSLLVGISYAVKEVNDYLEKRTTESQFIGSIVKRIDRIEFFLEQQHEINKDFEQRHRAEEAALKRR